MARRTACITDRARQRFLDELAVGHTVTHAAKAAGSRSGRSTTSASVRRPLPLAWSDAIEAGSDFIEDEARRRAVDGTERPIMYRGEVVGQVREYSDRLLELMLKARRPERYREKVSMELSASLQPSPEALARAREAGMDEEVERAAHHRGDALAGLVVDLDRSNNSGLRVAEQFPI